MLRRVLVLSFLFLAFFPLLAGSLLPWESQAILAQNATLRTEEMAGLRPRNIGPAVMSGRIVDLAVVEMDPHVFYVASATGGLWKTTNNGVTFTALFTEEPVHSIGDVAVHQVDTSIVWVGSGERASRHPGQRPERSWRHPSRVRTRR